MLKEWRRGHRNTILFFELLLIIGFCVFMNIVDRFRILHTPKDSDSFEQFIIQECCSDEKFISENNKSFSFDAFIGCSNGCSYCFMNRKPYLDFINNSGPQIKKCLRNRESGESQILYEIQSNLLELKKYGLMTSFITDPFLPEVLPTTVFLINTCRSNGIPLKVLTKRTDWINKIDLDKNKIWKDIVSFGFTLTNVDEMESQASPNRERIQALIHLSDMGFKTFCSIEPLIDCEKSYLAIFETFGKCDYYKIGLDALRKYDTIQIRTFLRALMALYYDIPSSKSVIPLMYIKDNVIESAGYSENTFYEILREQ